MSEVLILNKVYEKSVKNGKVELAFTGKKQRAKRDKPDTPSAKSTKLVDQNDENLFSMSATRQRQFVDFLAKNGEVSSVELMRIFGERTTASFVGALQKQGVLQVVRRCPSVYRLIGVA